MKAKLPLPISTMKAISELKISPYRLGRALNQDEHSINSFASHAIRELAEYNYDEAVRILGYLEEYNLDFDFKKHRANILRAKKRYEKI